MGASSEVVEVVVEIIRIYSSCRPNFGGVGLASPILQINLIWGIYEPLAGLPSI